MQYLQDLENGHCLGLRVAVIGNRFGPRREPYLYTARDLNQARA